jgi:hypothetical protein
VSIDSLHGPLLACALCGGTVDDLVLVLGSSVGLTDLAIGFEAAFQRASRVFGWQLGDEIGEDLNEVDPAESPVNTNKSISGPR